MRHRITAFTVLAAVAAAFVAASNTDAAEPAKRERRSILRPIANPKFDPTAEHVALFDGIKEGTLETKVIANGPEKGTVLITNTTEEPLTVDLPKSFVAVHVLKQFGQGGGGFGGGGFGGGQQGGLGGGQGGGQQAQGGGFGGGQQGGGGAGFGGGGQQGGGGGFFSVPPEKTVKVAYKSVCLEHGKPDPTPRANYVIIPTDEYTKDPVLQELIAMVGTGKMAPQSAQAAVWSRTDNMSWQQLAGKVSYGVLGNKVPYFSRRDLQGAQVILATAEGRVRERGDSPEPKADIETVRARVR